MNKRREPVRLSSEAIYDQRSALVKSMRDKESAAQDAKTARLRALRLAKEAQDKAEGAALPREPKNGR